MYIFSRRTPTALLSSSCRAAGQRKRRPGVPAAAWQVKRALCVTDACTPIKAAAFMASTFHPHRFPLAYLGCDLLLCHQHHAILAEHANGCACIGDGLHGILDLIQATLRTKDRGSAVIAPRHGWLFCAGPRHRWLRCGNLLQATVLVGATTCPQSVLGLDLGTRDG